MGDIRLYFPVYKLDGALQLPIQLHNHFIMHCSSFKIKNIPGQSMIIFGHGNLGVLMIVMNDSDSLWYEGAVY
jgi:hypothetical protein